MSYTMTPLFLELSSARHAEVREGSGMESRIRGVFPFWASIRKIIHVGTLSAELELEVENQKIQLYLITGEHLSEMRLGLYHTSKTVPVFD